MRYIAAIIGGIGAYFAMSLSLKHLLGIADGSSWYNASFLISAAAVVATIVLWPTPSTTSALATVLGTMATVALVAIVDLALAIWVSCAFYATCI